MTWTAIESMPGASCHLEPDHSSPELWFDLSSGSPALSHILGNRGQSLSLGGDIRRIGAHRYGHGASARR